MTNTISTATILAIAIELIIIIAMPIALLIFWKAKMKVKLFPAVIGALTFVLFALVLESISHYAFLQIDSPISQAIKGNPWLFALYSGLAAGLFEETGRFVAFKYVLKKHSNKETAITYGIGHGGIEAILVVGVTLIMYLVFSLKINAMGLNEFLATFNAEEAIMLEGIIESLIKAAPINYFWGALERLSALLIHISLSVLLFTAVHNVKKRYIFPLAIVLHALIDFPAALYKTGIISNIAIIELILLLIALVIASIAYKYYKQSKQIEETNY